MTAFFVHGVPDTPHMWQPLLSALALPEGAATCAALPGFGVPMPAGFSPAKEAYVDWLIATIEAEVARSGPVDLVGHDWGGLLCLRAAHLRPDLVASLAVFNACVTADLRWHKLARTWQRPVMGEIAMLMTPRARMERALAERGMPPSLAAREAAALDWRMKRAILGLYRSAVDIGREWGTDFGNLPARTALFWGENDPFGRPKHARRFCERWSLPLTVVPGVGHWGHCEAPDTFAAGLSAFWAGGDEARSEPAG